MMDTSTKSTKILTKLDFLWVSISMLDLGKIPVYGLSIFERAGN